MKRRRLRNEGRRGGDKGRTDQYDNIEKASS
jgi:hypothetical protein